MALWLTAATVVSTWQAVLATQARREAEVARANEAILRQHAEAREKITKARILFKDSKFEDAEILIDEIPTAAFQGVASEAGEMIYTLANRNGGEHRWKKAAAQFAVLLYGSASGGSLDIGWDHATMSYLEYAPLLVELGDTTGYEKLRESAIAILGNTSNSAIAERALMVGLLLPANTKQMAALDNLANLAARTDPASKKFAPWAYAVLALNAYRRGNFSQSVEWSQRCLSYPDDSPPRSARAHVLLAMAFFRLNQDNLARAELAKCRETIESKFQGKLGTGRYSTGLWHDWLINRILLREAEMLSSAAHAVTNGSERPDREATADGETTEGKPTTNSPTAEN